MYLVCTAVQCARKPATEGIEDEDEDEDGDEDEDDKQRPDGR